MINNFEDFQKMSKDNIDLALVSAGAVGKGIQALASEAADYSKQSFEAGSAAFERLLGAGSLDKAVEVQSEYVRAAYESGNRTCWNHCRDDHRPQRSCIAERRGGSHQLCHRLQTINQNR